MLLAALTGFLLTGTVNQFGQSYRFELAAASGGAFDFRKEGPAGERLVWDGSSGWRVDADGRVMPLELFDLEQTRLTAWLAVGSTLGWRANVSADTLVLPGGRLVTRVTRNSDGDIALATWPGVSGEVAWSFDWTTAADGVPDVAARWTQRVGDLVVETMSVTDVNRNAEFDPSRFAEPPRPADDAIWLPEAPDTLEIMRAQTGHLLIRPRLNGRDVGWFIFDTGAGESVVTPAVAAQLGLPEVGRTVLTSILGSAESPVYGVDTLDVGRLRLAHRRLTAMDLAPFEGPLGVPLSGVLGGEVLSRAILTVETAVPRLTVQKPDEVTVDAAAWRPLHFNQRLPLITADFAGGTGELFRIDVGAGGSFGHVAFHSPAVARLGLLAGNDSERLEAAGMTCVFAPIAWFNLAGHRFENEPVVYVEKSEGPMADSWVTGNIGVELLKPFRVIFDCPNRRIAFVPR
ncbi:MAG TPA: aspartyl protease family protein [Candidatus Eisenbacteria bacterium]